MSLFWLSFCDPRKPPGEQFLGACVVDGGDSVDDGENFKVAVQRAWRFKCNPGGEIQSFRILPEMEVHVGSQWRYRLLTRAECAALNREVAPHSAS
jgi:hypothetical protein